MCLFVQICTDAPTWDQGQGESELLVLSNEKLSCQPLIPHHKKVKGNLACHAEFSKEVKMKHIILAKSEGDNHLT